MKLFLLGPFSGNEIVNSKDLQTKLIFVLFTASVFLWVPIDTIAEDLVVSEPFGTCTVAKETSPRNHIKLTLGNEEVRYAAGFKPVLTGKGVGWQKGAKAITEDDIAACLNIFDPSDIKFIAIGPDRTKGLASQLIAAGFGFKLRNSVSVTSDSGTNIYDANKFYQVKTSPAVFLLEPLDFDIKSPALTATTPSDDATDVAVNAKIELTFSENVEAGTGNITLYDNDGNIVEVFDVTADVSVEGTTLTMSPSTDLAPLTGYYLQVDATAVKDSEGNRFAGIADATTLNFTTAAPPNAAPVGDAGPDQTVASGAAVTLDGSISTDGDGDTLSYIWKQLSGATVVLSSTTVAKPTFTAPKLNVGVADATLVFSLTVNDGKVSDVADTVTITVQAPSPSPASAFEEYKKEIRATLVDDASRILRSNMTANQRLIRNARDRMVVAQRRVLECRENQNHEDTLLGAQSNPDPMECEPYSGVSTQNVSLGIDGKAEVNNLDATTQGSFFGQTENPGGTERQLFFGDFDVHHDSDTESTTATLSARVAWEHMTTDNTLLGYFVGGEVARSDISGTFNGDQDRSGLIVGGYAVHQLDAELFLDGFISYGVGRNELEMSNDVLALTSDHSTRATIVGAAVAGVFDYQDFEFRPELAFNYGKTWIGVVGFTGHAYGLVDNTLSLDAGSLSIANLTLRPELIWALDADTVVESNAQLSFAPRAICERISAATHIENCGGGAELGLSRVSEDESSTAEFRVIVDRLGDTTRSSAALSLEHKF